MLQSTVALFALHVSVSETRLKVDVLCHYDCVLCCEQFLTNLSQSYDSAPSYTDHKQYIV